MLLFRTILSVATILCGIVILAEMLPSLRYGLAILPGLVLGAAMIALGAHRLSLIVRARKTT
jgi:uncharacterized membrane protein HdeD (DUF308 family)